MSKREEPPAKQTKSRTLIIRGIRLFIANCDLNEHHLISLHSSPSSVLTLLQLGN